MKKDLTNILGYIYTITAPNGAVYVGQTINVKERKYSYKKYQFKKQTKLWNSCQKYNWNPSESFEVIDECLCGGDKVYLNEREMYWISYYDSFKNGLNCTLGGKGQVGKIWTKEEREKQCKINIENGTGFKKGNKVCLGRKLSEEHKNKISESNKGHKAWNKDKETPIEVKNKISESTTGNKNHFYGKTHTPESIEKIINANLGRKHSEETKLKMSKSSNCKYYQHVYGIPILQFDMNNNFIKEFKSIKEASIQTGCSSPRIVDVCKGNRKHTKGYIWKYKIDI